jgi:hypothetical protein
MSNKTDEAEYEAQRRKMPGQVIDDLGARIPPGRERMYEHATKALVILVVPGDRFPEAVAVVSYTAGALDSVPEQIGLLEVVKAALLSERNQAEAMRAALLPSAMAS